MTKPTVKRKIRSFVRRDGRMTRAQVDALKNLWPRYGLEFDAKPIDFKRLFSHAAPVILEIGFGMGQALLAMAEAQPNANFLGVEVHRPGIAQLMKGLDERGLDHVRICQCDAVDLLNQSIGDETLSQINIFFPDPWPKRSHHKRRLIQAAFVDLLASKLKKRGRLCLATDWQDYALQMMKVVSACSQFENEMGEGAFSDANHNERPSTKFERRGQRLGHGIWDLSFRKTNQTAQ